MEEQGAEEYSLYWETKKFLEDVELESFEGFNWDGLGTPDEGICTYHDSSSLEGSTSASSKASKNVVDERNRRKEINEKLYNLRSMVPNISKMDKVSIITDAINYIQKLQEEERKILAEMAATTGEEAIPPIEQNDWSSPGSRTNVSTGPPVEITDLQLREVGERISLVSMRCRKRRGTIAKLSKAFSCLRLKILSGNITSFSGELVHNLLVETDQIEGSQLKEKIETAISGLGASRK